MAIGDNVKAIRNEQKLTQTELANKMGISRSYLGDIENNRKNPSSKTLEMLAEKLEVSMLYLLEGRTEREYFIDEIMEDENKRTVKEIKVKLPCIVYEKDSNGVKYETVLSEDELKRRLFDLHELLNMNVDLYYNNKSLSNDDKTKVLKVLENTLSK